MTSVLQKLAKEAEATFSKSRVDESFTTSLNELIKSVNNIQASDLNINPNTIWKYSNSGNTAPIIGIPVFINNNFSIDVFVLQDGASLPLHDHPGMYGISKAIHGTLRITSYNLVSDTPNEQEVAPDDIDTKTKNLKLDEDCLIPVELHMCKEVTSKDEPCLLTPVVGNYHEISAVNGIAALIDIISPTYNLERRCHRYSLLETKGSDSKCKLWLSELADMGKFWYNVFKFSGPKITL